MSKITAAITAVGGYVPDYILTNAELEKLVDTTDEWITSRTGIKEVKVSVLPILLRLQYWNFAKSVASIQWKLSS